MREEELAGGMSGWSSMCQDEAENSIASQLAGA
jgi:hypothetical protein